jgi:type I restriction enzyme S subunit
MERIKNKRKGYYKIFPEDWQIASVGSLVKRIKDEVKVSPSTTYREIGIRSHGKGIFHKKEVLGESLGNKSVFWVKPDCFIVNIVFAWELAVAKTTINEDGFIASHRFPMYAPLKDKLDLDFLLYYFKTPFGKHLLNLASPGGAGRNKTLGQIEFSKLKLCIPKDIKEQQKIVEVLSTWDEAISLKQQLIEQKKEQKKGLTQLLLTGKIRVTEMDKLSSKHIKKRVAEIQQGIVPEGYQKTKVGIVPSDWKIVCLKNISKGKGMYGINAPATDYSINLPRYLRITDIDDDGFVSDNDIKSVNHPDSDSFLLKENDLLFTRTGSTTGKTYLYSKSDGKLVFAGFLIKFSINETKASSYFVKKTTETHGYWQWVKTMSKRSGQPGINSEEYAKLKISLPPLPEQQKIAEIFQTADNEIKLLETELGHLKKQKKGLMQLLLTGKIRVTENLEQECQSLL